MISTITLENLIFIDIETVPQHENHSELDNELQELWAAKTKYQRKDETSAEDFYESAGIWAEFGKIVCISVGYFWNQNGGRQFRTMSFHGEEKTLLDSFCQLVNQSFSSTKFVFCGHNIKEFDLPFIARRLIINQMTIPPKLELFGKKPWEIMHVDTLELWKFGDYKHYTSLKLLCKILDIPTSKGDIDGSQVGHVFYVEKDIKRIACYCEKDVVAVAQILLRMRREPILRDEEIVSV